MLTLEVGVLDLSRVRFAISPVWELTASLRVLRDPGAHPVHLPWVRQAREALPGTRLELLPPLVTGHPSQLPGFLAPAPTSPLADVGDEIRAVAEADPAVVRREVRSLFGNRVPESLRPFVTAPRRALRSLAGELERYWEAVVAPHWPRMEGLLQGDVVHRGRALASDGPAAMFGALDPTIAWTGSAVTVDKRGLEGRHVLGGRGLVLVPSLFSWPTVWVKAAEPYDPVIRYPARGVGALWESPGPPPDLAASLGPTRARLLELLADPMTTTELARVTGLAPGGVSDHLARLVRSGLAARHRHGRTVAYLRTARAEALVRDTPAS